MKRRHGEEAKRNSVLNLCYSMIVILVFGFCSNFGSRCEAKTAVSTSLSSSASNLKGMQTEKGSIMMRLLWEET
ncbi:hypothetical protein DL93DRAFT_578440 [Clavulina sp. PMI_390]|nr:hypothetical protein DL93DRAFT_578440 [Clavulina sp. PMI_390]